MLADGFSTYISNLAQRRNLEMSSFDLASEALFVRGPFAGKVERCRQHTRTLAIGVAVKTKMLGDPCGTQQKDHREGVPTPTC